MKLRLDEMETKKKSGVDFRGDYIQVVPNSITIAFLFWIISNSLLPDSLFFFWWYKVFFFTFELLLILSTSLGSCFGSSRLGRFVLIAVVIY